MKTFQEAQTVNQVWTKTPLSEFKTPSIERQGQNKNEPLFEPKALLQAPGERGELQLRALRIDWQSGYCK